MNRNKEIYKVTIIGGAVNVILLLFKFVAGILGNSAAMIADAVHSLSDFVTDIIVILFVRISGKPKDKSHDYGHGKYETLAMTIIGLALLVVAVGILYNGVMKIVSWANGQQLAAPSLLALWAAILSIILKEVVYQYSIMKANQLASCKGQCMAPSQRRPIFHWHSYRHRWRHLPRTAVDGARPYRISYRWHLHLPRIY